MSEIEGHKQNPQNDKNHTQTQQQQQQDPTPNRGASIPDFEAIGPTSLSQEAWRKARGIDRAKQVKIKKLSHMRYQHPDLEVIITFLKDFGMTLVKKTETESWFRGYGPDQYVYYARQGPRKYLGGTFEVESVAELEKILKEVPGLKVTSNGIEDLSTDRVGAAVAPGGGKFLSITDPEGFPVNFICDQSPVSEAAAASESPSGPGAGTGTGAGASNASIPKNLVINYETEKPRKRAFHRFVPGPASVYKLGHFGLCVDNFQAQMDWYTRYFNIVPSDVQFISDGPGTTASSAGSTTADSVSVGSADADADAKTDSITATNPIIPAKRREVAVFAHIDRGQELVDHHTMFLSILAPGIERHVHHSSFEVHDFDTQALGHQWLKQKGYESEWGIGRHILGSQIFDYWWDPNRFMVEHYADGDLVNEDTPVGYGPAGPETLAIWGPEVPKEFLD